MPQPQVVLKEALLFLGSSLFYRNLYHSLSRLFIAFTSSLVMGLGFGLIMGFRKNIRLFLQPFFAVMKTTPVMAIVILAIIWFPTPLVPIMVCSLIMIPLMMSGIRQGIEQMDNDLWEMSELFQVKRKRRLLWLLIPHLKPYLINASVSCFSIGFKALIAAEVLAQPTYGLGSLLANYKALLQTEKVMAVTLVAVLLSVFFEYSLNYYVGKRKYQ